MTNVEQFTRVRDDKVRQFTKVRDANAEQFTRGRDDKHRDALYRLKRNGHEPLASAHTLCASTKIRDRTHSKPFLVIRSY